MSENMSSRFPKSLQDRKGAAWAGVTGVTGLLGLFLYGVSGLIFGLITGAILGLLVFVQKAEYRDGKRFVDGVEDEEYSNRGVSPKQGRGPKE